VALALGEGSGTGVVGGIGDGTGGGVIGGASDGIVDGSDCAPAGDGPADRPPPPEIRAPAIKTRAMNERMYLCINRLLRKRISWPYSRAVPARRFAKTRPGKSETNLTRR
jgi:hypothetical protein